LVELVEQVNSSVRRGPDWRYGAADGSPPGLGIVTSVCRDTSSANSHQISVQWNSAGPNTYRSQYPGMYGYSPSLPMTQSYRWDPTSQLFDLQQVNPADSKSTPQCLSLPAGPETQLAGFKRGDKVRLRPGTTGTSLLLTADNFKASSEACLGKSCDGRIGIVVDIGTLDTVEFPLCYNPSLLTVANLVNGVLCQYLTADLCYADGSLLGPLTSVLASVPTSSFVPSVGDRVRLSNSASNSISGKCLGSADRQLVGTIVRRGIDKRCSVLCTDVRCHMPGQISLYSADDLRRDVPIKLLRIGDRVVLDKSFFNLNDGIRNDGWCLGTKQSKIIGVVRFAPPPEPNGRLQRNILVCAAFCNSDRRTRRNKPIMYAFKSSWLIRADSTLSATSTISGSGSFKPGDRVQLNPGCNDASFEIVGKCLGSCLSSSYGIVLAVGPERDGIHRNIEVVKVSCSSDFNRVGSLVTSRFPIVSVYPSYVLVAAVRSAVLVDEMELRSLSVAVESLLEENGISGIDVMPFVIKYGQEVSH
jgi:hypothetical protein